MEMKRGHGDPSATRTLVWGIVGAILVFVMIVALQAFYSAARDKERERKVVAQAPEELGRLIASQQEILNSYRWIDEANGVVGIPIDRAMEILVDELSEDSESPAGSEDSE
jgi:hypothetical protein